jgi:hypothetical protein
VAVSGEHRERSGERGSQQRGEEGEAEAAGRKSESHVYIRWDDSIEEAG